MIAPMELAYRVQKRVWKLFRPRTRGVKIMLVTEAGEILLVRNSYGATHLWVLPGGGIRPWEAPELGLGVRSMKSSTVQFAD